MGKILENKQYLVADNEYRDFLLSRDFPVKVFTVGEAESILLGEFSPLAALYLSDKYHVSYALSSIWIKNIKNLRVCGHERDVPEKIRHLVQVDQDLKDNGWRTPSYRASVLKRGLTLSGSDYNFGKITRLLDDNHIPYKKECKSYVKRAHDVYVYENRDLEIVDTFNYLAEMLDSGLSYQDIVLVAPEEYHYSIRNIGNLFHIPVISENHYLAETQLYLTALGYIKAGIKVPAELYDEQENEADWEKEIKNDLRTLIEETESLKMDKGYDDSLIADYFQAAAAEKKMTDLTNGLSLSSSFGYYPDRNVVVLGFLSHLLPIHRDNEYLSDREKRQFSYLPLSAEKNEMEEKAIRHFLDVARSVRLSYVKDNDDKAERLFLEDATLSDVEDFTLKKERYSKAADEYLCASYELKKRLYGFEEPLGNYLATLGFENINSYDNNCYFVREDGDDLSVPKISFSAVRLYLECPFKYFCSRVLSIGSDNVDNDAVIFGNLVHAQLEKFNRGEDEHIVKPVFLPREEISYRETYFIDKRIEAFMNLAADIENAQSGFSGFARFPESSYELNLDEKHRLFVKFDLLLTDDKYYIVFDYKTGDEKFEKEAVTSGFSMQLMIYLLAAEMLYPEKRSLGAFFTLIGQEKLSFAGITSEKTALSLYLNTYMSMISGKRNLTYVVDHEYYEFLLDDVKTQLFNAVLNIESGKFPVHPKRVKIGTKPIGDSCGFCEFKDVCGLRPAQIENIYLKKPNSEDDGEGDLEDDRV